MTNIPSPYIVDYLNELGKWVELTAVFERADSSERDESWKNYRFLNFTGIVLKGFNLGVDQAIAPKILKFIKKDYYSYIIVANPCTPTGIIALEYMKLKKIPYMIESEGGFAKDGIGIKERLKKQIISGASLYFSTGEVTDNYFLTYGAKKDRIIRFPFTTLYQSDIIKNPLSKEEKEKMKQSLNFPHEKMILSIGRFIPIKGFDLLFEACKNLPSDVGICIIGGVETKEYIKMKERLHLNRIYFKQHLTKNELKQYYLAADLFVLPTRSDTWGLVIPEAMSYGLPVISTNRCIAALTLIRDYYNGFVVPIEDVEVLEDRIKYLLNNEDMCKDIAEINVEQMKNYTIEEMAQIHLDIFNCF